ncbi:OsmC family protein [Paludibaculum fermentans]|uniref:OsmC family protein n=1 Tax=Paludibaculum fermentans TaxID=1473598 RepID=A0A7S7NTC7_PALFE|nr:OsmC family protein [Paludibaculum fermentans]QOY89427.1 OsmC family protein [Paludibaculum fermentans]
MELTVNYLGDAQFEAEARGHKIICDQPLDNGGADEGMTPPELLLASLATCAGYYAVQYLNVRKLESAGLRVKITAEKAKAPARLDQFVIGIEVPGVFEEKDVEGLRRSAEKCLIKNTMLATPAIAVEIRTGSTVSPVVEELSPASR